MQKLLAKLALFAVILNLVPLHSIHATAFTSGFELRGFRLVGSSAAFVGPQQSGPGDVVSNNNGTLGSYMEGMCVPLFVELKNNTTSVATLDTDIVYDSYHAGAGVPLFEGLEAVDAAVSGFNLVGADDLNDFFFTGNALSSAPITTLNNVPLNLVVGAPAAGTRVINGANPLVVPVETQSVNVSVAGVPVGDMVRIALCARLGQAVRQANYTMQVTLSDDAAEIARIRPSDVLEGPATVDSATIQGIVYNDLNGNAEYDENDADPATRFDNHTVTLYDANFVELDSMLTGQSNSNDNLSYASSTVASGQYRFNNLPAGIYHICHATPVGSGWTRIAPTASILDQDADSYANISTVAPPLGETEQCYTVDMTSVANQDFVRFALQYVRPTTATLRVEKHLVGAPQGVLASDFSYDVTLNSAAPTSQAFADAPGYTDFEDLLEGTTYSVVESTVSDDYTVSYDGDCSGTIVADQNVTCSVTNTYVPPKGTITLMQNLPNDNGGTETSAAFDFSIDGNLVTLGNPVELDPGQYDITEVWNASHFLAFPGPSATLDTWYDVSYSCTDGGPTVTTSAVVDLADDQAIVCTITTDDKPASITLTKVISGGPSVPASSFGFTVTGTNVVVDGQGSPASSAVFAGSDVGTQIVLDAGAFTLQEDANPNYISTMSAVECDGIVLVPGQHLDCVATNTYIVVPVVEDGWLQGFFYKDLNANGTYDEGPGFTNRLNGVQVTLYDSSWVELSHMTTGTASATSGSVRPGQYRFRLLPAGVYYVCSADMAPGFDQTSPESGFKDPVLGASPNLSSVTDPNVAGQYCYRMNLATDQHRNLLRFGFQPVNQNPTRELTGSKFEDEDGNGLWSKDEEGIEDWTMYLVTEAEGVSSFTVDANSEAVGGSQDYTFESGKTYIVRASGTFTAGDSITADAKYSVRDPNTEYTDLVQNYEGFGPTLLELTIDDAAQNWGEFVSGHVYFTKIEGTGDTKTFEIEDIFPSNNQGSLSIQVFEVLQTTQTDEEGDYEFNITGLQGDLYVIEDTNQAGYVQTYPGSPNYMYTVPAGTDDVVENDFGNRQIGRATPTAEIVPTLSCVENLGEGTYKAHFGYTSANSGVVFIEAGTFENRIVGGGLIGGTDHGQPSSFEPGTQADDFEVIFAGAIPLTWTVVSTDTNSVTADQNSTLCGSHQEPEESTLTVNVGVSGGSAVAGNFHVFLNGAGSELAQGTPMNLAPGSYTLLQTSTVPDYVTSFSGDCVETTTDHAAGDISANEQAVCSITNTYVGQESNGGGGGGGGGGNGSGIGPNSGNNNGGNGGGGSDDPDPIVLGDSDEVDPGSANDSNNDSSGGNGGGALPPLPVPEVAGVKDELPRTGVPVAGLLGLGSLLAFWARRREQE